MVNHLIQSLMPGLVVRHHVLVGLHVGHGLAVLDGMEWDDLAVVGWDDLAVTDTKDEVAGSMGILHSIH